MLLGGGAQCAPIQDLYTSGSGTETIPDTGCHYVDIEKWDGGAGAGTNHLTTPVSFGSGGGGGGYAIATYSVAGYIGQTMDYSVGAGGAVLASGGITTVSSGTFTITELSASSAAMPGEGGSSSPGGTGSIPTGGTTNTDGNSGHSGSSSEGQPGGAAIAGKYGNAFGDGGASGDSGSNGGVSFYYHN